MRSKRQDEGRGGGVSSVVLWGREYTEVSLCACLLLRAEQSGRDVMGGERKVLCACGLWQGAKGWGGGDVTSMCGVTASQPR